jgi:hypothetical protein
MLMTPLVVLRVLAIADTTGTINKMIKKATLYDSVLPILVEIEALNEGIIPYIDAELLSKSLSSLPPEEARKVKRKFRKMHRRLQKTIKTVNPKISSDFYGSKSKMPTPTQKARRKDLVFEYLQLQSMANVAVNRDDK